MTAQNMNLAPVFLTEEMVEGYLQESAQQGSAAGTVHAYRTALRHFYHDLPADKHLKAGIVEWWKTEMETRGYSAGTVSTRIHMLNKFLRYLGKDEWQLKKESPKQESPPRESLTRSEYQLLLQVAKRMGRRRSYLLIKTMVNAGLKTQELPQLTVEALGRGEAVTTSHGLQRRVPIPEPLRGELWNWAAQEGVNSGPVFVTKEGTPMVHSAVWKEVKLVCRSTGLAEEKGTPRSLSRLYQTTYRGICADSIGQTDQLYRNLLEQEERTVAWSV